MATPVNLLQLSPTMTDGIIVKWLVKEGDQVESGQPIAEVETDKAVMEQESFEDGTILKTVVAEGSKVAVGALITVIGEKGEDISGILSSADNGSSAGGKKEEKKPAAKIEDVKPVPREEVPTPAVAAASSGRVLASPLARKMADENGLDITRIKGTGPQGRVVKRDIEEAVAAGTATKSAAPAAPASAPAAAQSVPRVAPAPVYSFPEEAEEVSLSKMRETIGRRLAESKQTVPHFQLVADIRGEKLLAAVDRVRAAYPDEKITVSHFLIKAMASAAMSHRAIRSQWAGDKLVVLPDASISVAVAIDEGLVTPVIRRANAKGLVQISHELRDLAKLARERKLTAEDYSGGVQTLSNLGMYAIKEFNAIINPPESSILAIGAMEDRPVVENGQIVPGKVMTITMSCDHRVIDGAVGAQYLRDLKKMLEDPMMMLM